MCTESANLFFWEIEKNEIHNFNIWISFLYCLGKKEKKTKLFSDFQIVSKVIFNNGVCFYLFILLWKRKTKFNDQNELLMHFRETFYNCPCPSPSSSYFSATCVRDFGIVNQYFWFWKSFNMVDQGNEFRFSRGIHVRIDIRSNISISIIPN